MPWPCAEALAVVYGPTPLCPNGESSGRVDAVNGDNYGPFQVNIVHWRKTGAATPAEAAALLLDPVVNVRVAYTIYADQGWGPWSCAP